MAAAAASSAVSQIHFAAETSVLGGVECVKVDRIVGLVRPFDFGLADYLIDFVGGFGNLVRKSLKSHASVRALGSAVLIDLDVGSGGFADLLDLEARSSNDSANDGLMDEQTDFNAAALSV